MPATRAIFAGAAAAALAIAITVTTDVSSSANRSASGESASAGSTVKALAGSCEGLVGPFTGVPGIPAQITSAEHVEAKSVVVQAAGFGGAPYANGHEAPLPAHCLVRGFIAPQIEFELRLPDTSDWNGNYFQVFCTGACGMLLTDSCFPALERGFVVATNNGGHSDLASNGDGQGLGFGIWGWNNRSAEIDFGHRANHVQALVSKAVIKAYYGEAAAHSYGAGCSKGGQAAVMEAARYPHDFDGLIASAPVNHYSGRAGAFASIAQANHDANGELILDHVDLDTLHRAVLAKCDSKDGAADGVINDPASCDFRPETLLCSPGGSNQCFSSRQVAAVKEIYSAPKNSAGRRTFASGQAYGSEAEAKGVVTGIPGVFPSFGESTADGFLGYLAFEQDPGSAFTWKDFNINRDPQRMKALSPLWDVQDAKLDRYRDAGGKLLVYHGTADAGIPVLATIDWYKKLTDSHGGLNATKEFARLFLLPGAAHCNGGPGVDRIDPIAAIQEWVERGAAPQRLNAWREIDGKIERQMPSYAFPLVPRYTGTGDVTDPSNFKPVLSASW